MKRSLILLGILLLVNMVYTQSLKLEIDSVDVSGLNPGDKIDLAIVLSEISNSPANEIWGWQFFFKCDETVLTWDGDPADPFDGVSYYNPDIPWPLGALQFSHIGNKFTWLGGDGGNAYTVNTATLPATLAKFRFTYKGGSCDLTWSLIQKIEQGLLVSGKTEIYYNYDFHSFPVLNLKDGAIYINN